MTKVCALVLGVEEYFKVANIPPPLKTIWAQKLDLSDEQIKKIRDDFLDSNVAIASDQFWFTPSYSSVSTTPIISSNQFSFTLNYSSASTTPIIS
jgi:hypothetical protein